MLILRPPYLPDFIRRKRSHAGEGARGNRENGVPPERWGRSDIDPRLPATTKKVAGSLRLLRTDRRGELAAESIVDVRTTQRRSSRILRPIAPTSAASLMTR